MTWEDVQFLKEIQGTIEGRSIEDTILPRLLELLIQDAIDRYYQERPFGD
jgi:hypothetical protein